MSLTVTGELQQHKHPIETEAYFDEGGFEFLPELEQERLLSWIHQLERFMADIQVQPFDGYRVHAVHDLAIATHAS